MSVLSGFLLLDGGKSVETVSGKDFFMELVGSSMEMDLDSDCFTMDIDSITFDLNRPPLSMSVDSGFSMELCECS